MTNPDTPKELVDFLCDDPDEAVGMSTGMNADGTVNVYDGEGNSINAIAATPCVSAPTLLQRVNGTWYAFQSPNQTVSESTLIYKRSSPQPKKAGNVKVLFSVNTDTAIVLYVGGHQTKPVPILRLPREQVPPGEYYPRIEKAQITNTGKGYIVGVQFRKNQPLPSNRYNYTYLYYTVDDKGANTVFAGLPLLPSTPVEWLYDLENVSEHSQELVGSRRPNGDIVGITAYKGNGVWAKDFSHGNPWGSSIYEGWYQGRFANTLVQSVYHYKNRNPFFSTENNQYGDRITLRDFYVVQDRLREASQTIKTDIFNTPLIPGITSPPTIIEYVGRTEYKSIKGTPTTRYTVLDINVQVPAIPCVGDGSLDMYADDLMFGPNALFENVDGYAVPTLHQTALDLKSAIYTCSPIMATEIYFATNSNLIGAANGISTTFWFLYNWESKRHVDISQAIESRRRAYTIKDYVYSSDYYSYRYTVNLINDFTITEVIPPSLERVIKSRRDFDLNSIREWTNTAKVVKVKLTEDGGIASTQEIKTPFHSLKQFLPEGMEAEDKVLDTGYWRIWGASAVL